MSKKKRRIRFVDSKTSEPKWTPFERGTFSPEDQKLLLTAGEVPDYVYLNSLYQVNVRYLKRGDTLFPKKDTTTEYVIHLSIKRIDKQPIHDWRHLQRIKNEIAGPRFEAMELYPSEERLVDTSNQYHLWCLPEGAIFPWGYFSRMVSDAPIGGSVQRPFDEDCRPSDMVDKDQIRKTVKALAQRSENKEK